MTERLKKIYISDHLALLAGEIELAKRSMQSNRESDLGRFLEGLVASLESERESVRQLAAAAGGASSIKQGAVWIAERAGRLKLNGMLLSYSPLSRVIEIEGLILGATARKLFWRAVVQSKVSTPGIDPSAAEASAQEQLAQLLGHHAGASRAAFVEERPPTR